MARGNRGRRSNPAPPPPLLPGAASIQQLDPAAALAAYEHMRRGTHAKALRILEKEIDKLGGMESSPPFLLHAYSTAHKGAADVSADRKIRARHFWSAIEAARRATEVAPDSVVLAHSCSMLLLGACRDMDEAAALATYESIIAECERAIQIKDPSNPTLYHLVPADSDRPTADGALLSDLREMQQLVSTDLHRMRRYNEIKLKVAEFRRQQQHASAAASLAPSSVAGHCVGQTTGGLEQSFEVINESGKCKGQCIVPQTSADREESEKIQTRLDPDDFGCNFSTSDAYPNKQEEETPADETVEYRVRTNDELNLKQFAEQSTSNSTPFEFGNGTVPSDTVQIHDDDDYDRCFLEDLRKSIALISIAEEVHGSGLKSDDDDDKNCLLTVIIQSLWHLRGFRDELLKTSLRHKHVGEPRVVSCVACFYSQRYVCFVADGGQWVMYDDQTAKVVGDWIQVLIMCEENKIQPLVLLFEAAN
ncbi:hypothetical protein ACQ4PT_063451 [Festuca glaucescens]